MTPGINLQEQYIVPIKYKSKEEKAQILMDLQRIITTDRSGNPVDCAISGKKDPWLGDFILYQHLHKSVADDAHYYLLSRGYAVLPVNDISLFTTSK